MGAKDCANSWIATPFAGTKEARCAQPKPRDSIRRRKSCPAILAAKLTAPCFSFVDACYLPNPVPTTMIYGISFRLNFTGLTPPSVQEERI